MKYSLTQLAKALSVNDTGPDVIVTGVSIDSRTTQPGDVFFALQGEQVDGHEFIAQAIEKGAVACIISRSLKMSTPYLQVNDTTVALGQFAQFHRTQFNIPIALLTGSYGKTTVKEMLKSCLVLEKNVCANTGNFNNHIGLPLSLLQLNETHDVGVFEIGTNAPGEIRYLSDIAQPTQGIVVSVGDAHLEKLKNVKGVAQEKSDLYRQLLKTPEVNPIAIMNRAIVFSKDWLTECNAIQCITVNDAAQSAIFARDIVQLPTGGVQFTLVTPKGNKEITLKVLGAHQVDNAVCAAAMAQALGTSMDAIQTGLSTFRGVAGRMQASQGLHAGQLIDDTYNANLQSTLAAIQYLATQAKPQVLILGTLGECGEHARDIHQRLGQAAKSLAIDALYAVGDYTEACVEAFGKGQVFQTHEDLIRAVQMNLPTGGTVLVKGSRFMKMEKILRALKAQEA